MHRCGAIWVIVGLLAGPVNKMSNNGTATQIYNSIYRHGVDEKRRIQIPAMWRPVETGVQLTLIVWPQRVEGPCLRVLPPNEMAELMASLDAMSNDDGKKTILKRIIGAESTQVTLDKAGRICVPEEMAKAAGIVSGAALP